MATLQTAPLVVPVGGEARVEISVGEGGRKELRELENATDQVSSSGPRTKFRNRVRDIVIHIPWYSFKTQVRLAQDSGVSTAVISRLFRNQNEPSLKVSLRVTAALGRRLGRPLDVRDVFAVDGRYLTPSVCLLTGCRACLPPEAYDENEHLKPEFSAIQAGQWSLDALEKGGA